jgi:hypothetical protein
MRVLIAFFFFKSGALAADWGSAGAEHPEGGLLDGFCLDKQQAAIKKADVGLGDTRSVFGWRSALPGR